jgi:hypothetical protein
MDDEIDYEYEKINRLAEERWRLKRRLKMIDRDIAKTSFYWAVGKDGLVDFSTGIFH